MWHLYICSIVAGLIGANGVPHFIKGIVGEQHQTPFAEQSSAAVNVLWGWLNFVVASLLIYWGHVHLHLLRAFGLVAIGALITGLFLANRWSRPKRARQ